MSIHRLSLLLLASWLASSSVVVAEERPLWIMPLGDSITRGSFLARYESGPFAGQAIGLPNEQGGGYRKPLQDKLRAAGVKFDFVGGLDYYAFGRQGKVDADFDPDHHGLAGFSNKMILSGGKVPTLKDVLADRGVSEITVPGIVEVLEQTQPDVILLLSGANGFDVAAREKLVQTIGATSQAYLLVGTILPQSAPRPFAEQVAAYNAALPALIEKQRASGRRIRLVDMHAQITAEDLLPDGVHPTQAGMHKIADAWYDAIAAVLEETKGQSLSVGQNPSPPAPLPQGEREDKSKWMKETITKIVPIKRPANEPMYLKQEAAAGDVAGKSYDVIVVGGTSAGVMSAVRAAREGMSVLLVQHNRHVGGMMVNGLGQWDALYGGHRNPLFTELLGNIEGYYAGKYGLDSPQLKSVHFTHNHYPIGWVEPHVAEREYHRLLAGEKSLTLLLEHYPTAIERDGALLKSVTLCAYGKSDKIDVRAKVFIDGTYEGDLFALAKVPYHCGREARETYGEPHAGKVFTNIDKGPAPLDAAEGRLNIRPYGNKQGSIDPTSPYTGDRCIQAYNTRPCVTSDPQNRILLTEPPANYDRAQYLKFDRYYIGGGNGPNGKSHMNSPILTGENHDYPEADWPTREKIAQRHQDFCLGLIWFLQHDESISPAQRKEFAKWGLPKDEFTDNNHLPYEMYVREARRIIGRHVFKEQDNSLAKNYARTPIFSDAIAVTDWYMDSHACTLDHTPGHKYDGKLILTEESRPAQIPYRSLLPQEVDNLLVPACLSSTHIAWGAVRLEPVWMQTGESAGWAAALAIQNQTTPAALDPELLIRKLVEKKHFLSFFNDSNPADDQQASVAAQYFGTKGFFADYDARLDEPLSATIARVWADAFAQLRAGKHDREALAARMMKSTREVPQPISAQDFVPLLKLNNPPKIDGDANTPLTRGRALQLLWEGLSAR